MPYSAPCIRAVMPAAAGSTSDGRRESQPATDYAAHPTILVVHQDNASQGFEDQEVHKLLPERYATA